MANALRLVLSDVFVGVFLFLFSFLAFKEACRFLKFSFLAFHRTEIHIQFLSLALALRIHNKHQRGEGESTEVLSVDG